MPNSCVGCYSLTSVAWSYYNAYLPFQNTRVTLPPGAEAAADNQGCYFYLAGVDDFEADPDYGATLDGREDSIATVLLAHEPIQVRRFFGWACTVPVWPEM